MSVDDGFTAALDWEDDWLLRLQANEKQAWKDLFRLFAKKLRQDVRASVRKRGLSEDVADDIEQETWQVVCQKIHEFVPQTDDKLEAVQKLYNWMRVIALNRVRMLRRKLRDNMISFDEIRDAEGDGNVTLDYIAFQNDLYESNPEKKLLIREQVAVLEALLDTLSARDREILVRRLIGDEKPRDLAAAYGIEPRSISQILFRAKQSLKRQIS